MNKNHTGRNRKKGPHGSNSQAKGGGSVAGNTTQPQTYKETSVGGQGRNPVRSDPKHQHESSVDKKRGDGLWQRGGPSGADWNQSERRDEDSDKKQADGASNLVEDEACGTQMELSGQSEYEELPTDRSVTTGFEMSFLCTCVECQHDNSILKEMIDTHPNKDYYVRKLKQRHAEHEVKHNVISGGLPPPASEFKPPQHKSDIKAVSSYTSAKNEPSSSFPAVQQSYRDTTTNNEGKDDDKMDVCGPEERKGSSGSLPAADDTDWFEGSQVTNLSFPSVSNSEHDERERSDDRQQGNRRRAKEDDSRERRYEYSSKGRQGTDSWRQQDNRRPQDNDSRWSRDDRGGSSGNRKYDNVKYKIVKEVDGDLFTAPKECSLAHCVATDLRMGSGIAVNFRQTFKSVGELLDQRARVGHIAVLEHEGRFIYYLVTKRYSQEKPLFDDLVSSLEKMRNHCAEHDVKHLAMPRIGCGLDRLEWREVKPKIEEIFSGLDISITVYNFNQPEKEEDHYPKSKRILFVRHRQHRLVDIETQTALIFFGSEDGSVDNCGTDLDRKFNFMLDYKRQSKKIGNVIRLEKKGEVLYGLIVRQKETDVFSYINFEKCLYELRKFLKKDDFLYVGIEAFCVDDDPGTVEKVISVMKGVLLASGLELYVCWPKELQHYHSWGAETRE